MMSFTHDTVRLTRERVARLRAEAEQLRLAKEAAGTAATVDQRADDQRRHRAPSAPGRVVRPLALFRLP